MQASEDVVPTSQLREAYAKRELYNTQAPHSALGMPSPAEYRAEVTLSSR